MFFVGAIIGAIMSVGIVFALFWRPEADIIGNVPGLGESIGCTPGLFLAVLLVGLGIILLLASYS